MKLIKILELVLLAITAALDFVQKMKEKPDVVDNSTIAMLESKMDDLYDVLNEFAMRNNGTDETAV